VKNCWPATAGTERILARARPGSPVPSGQGTRARRTSALEHVAVVEHAIAELGSQRVSQVGQFDHESRCGAFASHVAVDQLPFGGTCAVRVLHL
jgi:hypothetical protein